MPDVLLSNALLRKLVIFQKRNPVYFCLGWRHGQFSIKSMLPLSKVSGTPNYLEVYMTAWLGKDFSNTFTPKEGYKC